MDQIYDYFYNYTYGYNNYANYTYYGYDDYYNYTYGYDDYYNYTYNYYYHPLDNKYLDFICIIVENTPTFPPVMLPTLPPATDDFIIVSDPGFFITYFYADDSCLGTPEAVIGLAGETCIQFSTTGPFQSLIVRGIQGTYFLKFI